jgi:D-3-phosphoglycerate dehydrogenase
MVMPPSVAVDARCCVRRRQSADRRPAVGGAENLDLEACARAGVEVVRPATASAVAEAEFAIGALLQMLRRVPVINAEGLAGRARAGGAVVGIVGMTSGGTAAGAAAGRPSARVSSATTRRCTAG